VSTSASDFFGIAKQVQQNAVLVSNGNFEEHPEAYRPRIFCHAEMDGKTYELLQDGNAIPWPKTPDPAKCGFDFWLIEVSRLKDLTMKRYRCIHKT
jgi:hypothetical protein